MLLYIINKKKNFYSDIFFNNGLMAPYRTIEKTADFKAEIIGNYHKEGKPQQVFTKEASLLKKWTTPAKPLLKQSAPSGIMPVLILNLM